jgi:glycosyltransferase involved in cell wall biosynthesis
MARIEWLASGLSPYITGVERVALSLATRLFEGGVVEPADIRARVDRDGELAGELTAMGVACVPGRLRQSHRPRLVHNFGRTLRAHRGAESYLFTVHDWGPFRDSSMPAKARLAWASSMELGHALATDVHYVNHRLSETRPRYLPKPRASFVCYSETTHTSAPSALADPEFALFVGTASPRKRLDALCELAPQMPVPVVLVGQGTEAWGGPNIDGRGRVSEAELEDAFRHAACILLVSAYEGFGVPILEGARRGIHSVVSAEVLENLPESLQGFCHPVAELTGPAMAHAVVDATAQRGGAHFDEDLFGPLVDYYSERIRRC